VSDLGDMERAALHKVIDDLKAINLSLDKQLTRAVRLLRGALDMLHADRQRSNN
jgi:hypothetical protein